MTVKEWSDLLNRAAAKFENIEVPKKKDRTIFDRSAIEFLSELKDEEVIALANEMYERAGELQEQNYSLYLLWNWQLSAEASRLMATKPRKHPFVA